MNRRTLLSAVPALAVALATALGLSWKVAVMAEVLGGGNGIGAELATARANLDTAEAMGWVVIAVVLLLACDGLLLAPVNRRLDRWRAPAAGGGGR